MAAAVMAAAGSMAAEALAEATAVAGGDIVKRVFACRLLVLSEPQTQNCVVKSQDRESC